ncbi:MAG: hypothetical protein AAGF87_17820, partial [Bacteroidota bacterium]
CEPSGIAGLALFLQMRDELLEKDPDLPNKKVLFVNTGKLKTELFQTIEDTNAFISDLRKKIKRRNQLDNY